MFEGEMFGRLIAGLIVVGLAIGVWVLWPSGDSDTTTTTLLEAAPTTTSSSTTTTVATTTSTTFENPEVVETVEQAEAILRELWFGWFEGIYNKDEERIKEVVANPDQVDAALAQFGVMEFETSPTLDGVLPIMTEILRADNTCTAIWSVVEISDFTTVEFSGVHVMRKVNDRWMFVSLWGEPNDIWEQDCEALLE